jgi:hypothetical protein
MERTSVTQQRFRASILGPLILNIDMAAIEAP